MQFWQENDNKFPKLYQLQLKRHCIPATSATMERCFSAAEYITNARRSKLTDQMLEDILIASCKCNKNFMERRPKCSAVVAEVYHKWLVDKFIVAVYCLRLNAVLQITTGAKYFKINLRL